MTHNPDGPEQDGMTAEKAIWQRCVRDHLLRAFAYLSQLKHPPRKVDLAVYMLEVLAEQTIDIDLLTLIGPFARKLPEAYKARGREARIVRRFENRRHMWKAGHWQPLNPLPGQHGVEVQPSETR